MTKIDGHAFYDQNFGHGQFGISTSDPTWQILRGGHVTKPNGRGSKLAQFISPMYMGQAQQFLGPSLFTSDFFSAYGIFIVHFHHGPWPFTNLIHFWALF
jgi:hypothetical protein